MSTQISIVFLREVDQVIFELITDERLALAPQPLNPDSAPPARTNASAEMDYLSYLYTPQQMSGGASFGHSTRIGNWSEDHELQQARIKEFILKKESGSLTVSRMQAKFAHHLKSVDLTKAEPGDAVNFGQQLLLWNHHAESFVATDLGDSQARADGATHCAVTCTKYSYPCARNAVAISRVQDDGYAPDDNTLHYGQMLRLSTTPALGEPLYMHSYPFAPTVCSKYSRNQEATFSTVPGQYTLWKVLHVNPQVRPISNRPGAPCFRSKPLLPIR